MTIVDHGEVSEITGIASTHECTTTLWWPPMQYDLDVEGPQIQLDTSGRIHHRSTKIAVRALIAAMVADPVCRAEIDLAIAMQHLHAVQEAVARHFAVEEAS